MNSSRTTRTARDARPQSRWRSLRTRTHAGTRMTPPRAIPLELGHGVLDLLVDDVRVAKIPIRRCLLTNDSIVASSRTELARERHSRAYRALASTAVFRCVDRVGLALRTPESRDRCSFHARMPPAQNDLSSEPSTSSSAALPDRPPERQTNTSYGLAVPRRAGPRPLRERQWLGAGHVAELAGISSGVPGQRSSGPPGHVPLPTRGRPREFRSRSARPAPSACFRWRARR